jgi:hypothetical protein
MVQFCFARSRSQRSTQSPQTTLPSRRMNTSSFERSQLPQRKPFSRLSSTSDGFILQTPYLPHPPARRSTVALCARLAKPGHARLALDAKGILLACGCGTKWHEGGRGSVVFEEQRLSELAAWLPEFAWRPRKSSGVYGTCCPSSATVFTIRPSLGRTR